MKHWRVNQSEKLVLHSFGVEKVIEFRCRVVASLD